MKVLLDTSVVVAALVETHEAHERALPWLQRAHRKEGETLVAAHTLAELYAVLTRLPLRPSISPELAWRLIRDEVAAHVTVVSLSPEDCLAVLEHLSDLGIQGGATYDALLAYTAWKAGVDYLITLNAKHFQRVYPELVTRIKEP
jgi:predicted nucleic acid-binding protein